MHIFARPQYESAFTQFLNEWKRRDPAIAAGQREGLALLWDKAPLDMEARQRAAASAVRHTAYTYE